MAAADELFLLSQKCDDIGDNLIDKWKIYFEWLDEVIHTSKQSRGEMVIPKTPARKKRVKKNEDLENLPPPPPPPTNDDKGVRKSSRAAAKVAQEKNKKTLIEISNINSKIRRPSTPPKIVKTEIKESISDEEEIGETREIVDRISPQKFSDDHYRRLCEEKIVNVQLERKLSENESERKLSEKESERRLSEKESERRLSEKESERKLSENESERKLSENESERKLSEKESERRLLEKESERKLSQKESKRKLSEKKDSEKKLSIANESDDENAIEIQEMPPPFLVVKKVNEKFQKEEHENMVSSSHSPVCNKPTRVTRTKKRVVEEAEQGITPIRSTRSKKIKIDETDKFNGYVKLTQLNFNEKSSVIKEEISHSPLHKHISKEPAVPSTTSNFPQRITRSKVRPMTPKKATPGKQKNSPLCLTPKNNNNNKAPHTPKNKFNSVLNSNQYSGSPKDKILQSKTNTVNKHTKNAVNVHEVSVESVKVSSSPTKVVKHKWNENSFMSENAKVVRSKTSYQTPSPASSSAIKILGLKSAYSSVGLQSAYSQKRKNLLSSPQIIGTKVIGTPTEVNRTKNILMGSSFITKVQPSKPTKEEMDDKKQEDLRRKREKEDETRKKKEDLLRMKMEEQKRKNEERMRRVQEARELREKKMIESREMQEREKKQREDRVKEEKRKKLMEAKKNEEMKQLLKKQAEEESRLKEERKIREEQRQMEELKAKEESKKMEERRKQEERKLMERHEAERLAKEKLEWEKAKAAERIAREKKELEQLRLKEIERLKSQKNMNETYTEANPMNSTYTKPASSSASVKNDDILSYEMTPLVKKVPSKSKSANDYGITDLRSDDSTDDESAPKKKIPSWAQGSQLRKHLFDQEHFPPNLDVIFDPSALLQMPDLIRIFPKRRSRFTKRTSSAVWNTPPYKLFAQK